MGTDRDYKMDAVDYIRTMVRSRDEGGLSAMYKWMDQAWRSEWELDSELAKLGWIYKSVSSDPHDALRGGTRTLSAVEPEITIYPLLPNRASRERANEMERVLAWQFKLAGRRRKANILRDMAMSALRYDDICVQVIHLPTQIKLVESLKGNPSRLRAMKRFGAYAIVVHHPNDVLVDYSEWMPERVALRKIYRAHQVLDLWGDRAEELRDMLDHDHHEFVSVYDYQDYDRRVVLAVPQGENDIYADISESAIEVMNEENDMPFLPWAVKVGGNTLDAEEEHQRTPLLYPVYQTKQWEAMNLLDTVNLSEVISAVGQMKYTVTGPTDMVDVDYEDPKRVGHVPPGHELDQMPPMIVNEGFTKMYDRMQGRIDKSTISRILFGEVPGGTAFATLNLQTQSAMKTLTPYKELTQDVCTEVYTIMLNWIHYSGIPLETFTPNIDYLPDGTEVDITEKITIGREDINPEHIYIDVKLTEDVPDDEVRKTNAAIMAVQSLNLPRSKGMERIGITDPEMMIKLRDEEDIHLATIQAESAMIMGGAQLKIKEQEMMLQIKGTVMQQQIAQQQAAQARQQQAGGQGLNQTMPGVPQGRFDPRAAGRGLPAGAQGIPQPNTQRPAGGNAFDNMGGAGNNPAMGGDSAARGNPSGTREEQQGLRSG